MNRILVRAAQGQFGEDEAGERKQRHLHQRLPPTGFNACVRCSRHEPGSA
jgi:hypothetical protein